MQGTVLEHVTTEEDLRLVIDTGVEADRTVLSNYSICKADRVFGCIRKGINCKSKEEGVLTLGI